MQIDLQQLEKSLFPMYKNALSNITVQKRITEINDSYTHTGGCLAQRSRQRYPESASWKWWHGILIQNLNWQTGKGNQRHFRQNHQITRDLRILIDSRDVCLVSEYKSNNEEFRKIPPTIKVFLPNVQPRNFKRENLDPLKPRKLTTTHNHQVSGLLPNNDHCWMCPTLSQI